MSDLKIIEVKQSIFTDNNKDADLLREQLKEEKTFLLNLMSSPGSGKTTMLLALADKLKDKIKWGVLEADIDIIFISAKTGKGVDELADWILKNVKEWCE